MLAAWQSMNFWVHDGSIVSQSFSFKNTRWIKIVNELRTHICNCILLAYAQNALHIVILIKHAFWNFTKHVLACTAFFRNRPNACHLVVKPHGYCHCQVTQQDVAIIKAAVEVITCVFQRSRGGKAISTALALSRAGCSGLSIARTISMKCYSPAVTTEAVGHSMASLPRVRSATCHIALRIWWSPPVIHVLTAGHKSTTAISWPSIRSQRLQWPTSVIPVSTSVSTELLKSQLGRLINLNPFFFSSKSAVELCRVPSITTLGSCRVLCAANDT